MLKKTDDLVRDGVPKWKKKTLYHLVCPDEAEVLACLKVEEGGLGAGAIGRLEPECSH